MRHCCRWGGGRGASLGSPRRRGGARDCSPRRSSVAFLRPIPSHGGPMDPGSIGALVPVAAILMFGAVKIAKIKAQAGGHSAATDPEATARLEALESELGSLRQELGEVH